MSGLLERRRNGANAYSVAASQANPMRQPPATSVGQCTPRYKREYRITIIRIAATAKGHRQWRSRKSVNAIAKKTDVHTIA